MSNTITITNRGDSSQSIGETNKLIARIAVLEDRLTKLTDKSSKQADMMGKGYASAEAKVKHFEKALKDASNVRMKFAALEGLQQAAKEFKVAKVDFESSMQIGHNPGVVVDTVIEATKKLGAVRANEWAAEQTRQMSFAALQQDIITRSKEQVAIEQKLASERSATAQASKMADHVNAWNAEKSQLRESIDLRNELISRMSAQVAVEKQLGQEQQVEAAKRLGAERANQWAADQSRQMQSKAFQEDLIARAREQLVVEKQIAEAKSASTQASRAAEHANQWNAEQLRKFDQRQSSKGIQGRLSSEAEAEKLAQQQRNTDMVGRLGAWQQSPHRSTMSSQLFEWQQKEKQNEATARRQAMLDRDAGVQERQMRIARARELDAKYASRSMAESFNASSLRGTGTFDSENALKDRRSLLQDRKAGLSPSSESYQKTIDELRQIEVILKRINAKPMKAVELGSPKALRQQIKYLEAEMAKIGAGPQWDKLNAKLASAKTQLGGMQQKSRDAEKALSQAATAPMGSWVRLEFELEKAKKELSQLTYGTKEFLVQQDKVAGLQKDWDNVNSAINRTNKTQKDGNGIIMSAIGQVKTLAATYIGVHQVMTQITAEWEKQRAFELDANKKGVGIEAEMVRQAANVGAENLPQVQKWARANQPDLLAKQADIIGLVGAAISSGEPDIQRAMKVTAAALKINVGDVQMANEMLQGGITIGRLNNSDNFESAFGQLRSSSKVSQAVDESEFIGNVTGKMAALTRGRKNLDGMTTERALEFITSASRIQVDRTGESSSTNMAAIFQRMDEFAPVAKKVLKDRSVSRIDQKSIDAFKAARSFDEKLEMLRSNKAMGEQFIDKQRTGGPKELAFALVQNSQSTKNIMKEAADAVLPFKDAGIAFRQAVTDVNKAVPNLIVSRQMEASQEQARTGSETQLKASARAVWDSVWNTSADGTAPVNLSGLDVVERATSWTDRASWASQRKTGALKDGGNEITDMVKSLKDIQTRNKDAGNMDAARSLDAQLKALQTIAEKLDELNAQVAAGRQGHHAVPRNVAPARVPPVPRVPIAVGVKSGDPFGMRKR